MKLLRLRVGEGEWVRERAYRFESTGKLDTDLAIVKAYIGLTQVDWTLTDVDMLQVSEEKS